MTEEKCILKFIVFDELMKLHLQDQVCVFKKKKDKTASMKSLFVCHLCVCILKLKHYGNNKYLKFFGSL